MCSAQINPLGRWALCAALFFSFIFGNPTFSFAQVESFVEPPAIVGRWQYVHMYYREQFLPPLNPDVRLIFEFENDGDSRIYWDFKNERGFCERRGRYAYADRTLEDVATWINPENRSDCARDPDMRLGSTARTEAFVKDGEFWLSVPLNDESLYYIFRLDTPEGAR